MRLKPEYVLLTDRQVREISAGDKHVLARTDTGAVFSWGFGKNGRLGHGDTNDRTVPCLINGLRGARAINISAGGKHSAIVADVKDQIWFKKGDL